MHPMVRRIAVYTVILLVVAAGVTAYILNDFAGRPYPPDMAFQDFDPRPMLVTEPNPVCKPRFPVFDFHLHIAQTKLPVDKVVEILDEAGVYKCVDLSPKWGNQGEALRDDLEAYASLAPDRFVPFFHLSVTGMQRGAERFVSERVAQIEQAAAWGVRGIKLGKELGMLGRNPEGGLLAIDAPRLDPIWDVIERHGLIVLFHAGDPPSFWDPIGFHNERMLELERAEDYIIMPHSIPGMVPLEEVLAQRERLVAKHPGIIFVGPHMAGLGWNLPELGRLFDTYPNFYADISDRLYEVGRQPYSGREFFITYQDRLLFGIDYIPEVQVYRDNYRILETFDEFVAYPRAYFRNVHWRVHGIGLPDEVLRKLYYANGERLLSVTEQQAVPAD
jgi:predicted TIM-barrel fold metal-dependent hydrolase